MLNERSIATAAARVDVTTFRVGDEIVAFDSTNRTVHALDPWSAAVLQACDSSPTIAELVDSLTSRGLSATSDTTVQTVRQLEAAGLVTVNEVDDRALSRRRAIRRLAAAGAVGVAAPVIQSVLLPPVAAAQSQQGGGDPGPGATVFQVTGSISLSRPTGGPWDEAQSTLTFSEVGGGLSGTWTTGTVPGSYTLPHSMTNPTGTVHWSDGTTSTATATLISVPAAYSPLTVSSLAFTNGPFSSIVTFSFTVRGIGTEAGGRSTSTLFSFGSSGSATVTLS